MTKQEQQSVKPAKILQMPIRSGKCELTEEQYCQRDAIVSQHIVGVLKDMFQALRDPKRH